MTPSVAAGAIAAGPRSGSAALPSGGSVGAASAGRDRQVRVARSDACATLPAVTDDRPAQLLRDVAAHTGDSPPVPAMTAAELQSLTGGRLLLTSARPIRGGAVDSRLVRPGELFVALRGSRTDGHRYIGAAARAGAAALLVAQAPRQDELAALGDITVVEVSDALRALHAVAGGWRRRFDPLVVGVTGSIAKTSTKEAVATVLAADRRTLRSEGNQNNEIGLPLAVLRLGPEDRAAVFEMGMYVRGEIRDLARVARPRIGVVTAVLGVHLSRIGSIDAVEDAKAELIEALPADGTAVLNADDPRVRRMAGRTAARTLTYGFAIDADVGAEEVSSSGLAGMRFTLRLPPEMSGGAARRDAASVPALGRLSVHNALAGAAVGIAAGMAPESIVAALAGGWSAPHRGQLIRAGRITIVDDTYNASPASMAAALELLGGLPGRRVAILGEMLELGQASDAGHRDVGRAAAAVCELLCVVGPGAAEITAGAREAGLATDRIIEVADREEAAERLRTRLTPEDVVLVKASRGVELDLLVDRLAAVFGGGGAR